MKLFLKNYQCPGDILMMTAGVRDLKRSYPYFQINVSTTASELWQNNPSLSPEINEKNADRVINCGYSLIHKSDRYPYHFIHGFRKDLERELGLRIYQGEFRADIFMKPEEMQPFPGLEDVGKFWIVDAGYKNDFTLKNWGFDNWQKVVDILKGKIKFVQIGAFEASHHHRLLEGAINLVGKTNIRQLMQLVYQSAGVLTPVSFPMHLAAAVPTRFGQLRPCIVIAGGREPVTWEQYPGHQFFHTIGMLPCCWKGGCWKSRAVKLNDGTESDKSLCAMPVKCGEDDIGKCMSMIDPEDVAKTILKFQA